MIKFIWRLAHLALAAIASLILIVASATGIILAYHSAEQNLKAPTYSKPLNQITVAQSLSSLKRTYPEITDISINKTNRVILNGFDKNNNSVKAVIDPLSGKKLGQPPVESPFIQKVISLHRSLFLHETGRFIIGLVAFLLLLITITGAVLFIQQYGFQKIFSKIGKGSSAQYIHVVGSKLLFIPILIIALTGTVLFMKRFGIIPELKPKTFNSKEKNTQKKTLADFQIFKETKLSEVEKIEFPFMDDPDEYFDLQLKDRELKINQYDGTVVSETVYPFTTIAEKFSLEIHTGRTSAIWSIVLCITSLSILIFIWSGFSITTKKWITKIRCRNIFDKSNSEIVILIGSETGSTLKFAAKMQEKLLASNHPVFVCDMNDYTYFPKAKHVIIMTSTYGRGEAPKSATEFEERFRSTEKNGHVHFTVVGFGSTSYKSFCAYASRIDNILSSTIGFEQTIELHTVNKRSQEDFASWEKAWSQKTGIDLSQHPS